VLKQLPYIVSAEFVAVESQEYLSFHFRIRNVWMAGKNRVARYPFGSIKHRTTHAQTLLTGYAHHHTLEQNSYLRIWIWHR
jgi:hypothetical protein